MSTPTAMCAALFRTWAPSRRWTGALVVRVCHTLAPVFDDPNPIAFGGPPAVLTLAEQAGLHDLVDDHVTVPGTAGSNASVTATGSSRA